MKQTPVHDNANIDLLSVIPRDSKRIVEVGSSSGALAREFKNLQPDCHYTGIEIDESYCELSERYCDKVVHASIEQVSDDEFSQFFPSDCWIFADVLEHLVDPWRILRKIKQHSTGRIYVAACIPNVQHWSAQVSINRGNFDYADSGIFDRTHLRWFTGKTIRHLFESTGFQINELRGRVFSHMAPPAGVKEAIRSMASASGSSPDDALANALPFQWVVQAVAKEARAPIYSMNFKLS